MSENQNIFSSLLEKTLEYVKTNIELYKLKALDTVSDSISTLIPNAIVLFFMLVFLMFINIGAAFWLGDVLGKTYLGFLSIAAFYLFLSFVLHFLFHKSIKKAFQNYIINQVYR